MRYRLTGLYVDLDAEPEQLAGQTAQVLGLKPELLRDVCILRQSLDARHTKPRFVYTISFSLENPAPELHQRLCSHPQCIEYPSEPISLPQKISRQPELRPVVAGAGPAGLFAGLRLARAGLQPIILERGDNLPQRIEKVNTFWETGVFDPESNAQFGMGGAGTFSDGKLTTRIKDPEVAAILDLLVEMGGPPEIRYRQHPHIGTDLLRGVITRLEEAIIAAGGEFHYRSKICGLQSEKGSLAGIQVNENELLTADTLVLATGNSSRELYELLQQQGFSLEAKPFAVGLRIEHPQQMIDRARLGKWAGHPRLGPAEYHLTHQDRDSGRGVYTFCMCPGGQVIAAASESGGVVTNGMSLHTRGSGIANAALVVTVGPRDFTEAGPLGGIAFQRELERKAFQAGGGGFLAPAQCVIDFLKQRVSARFSGLQPSYRPGVHPVNLWDVLPQELCRAIAAGLCQFGRQVAGFDGPEAVLTGVETRTSAPVRISRDESREAIGCKGVYPAGEGSGYAGGIISSALDGWKSAGEIIKRFV